MVCEKLKQIFATHNPRLTMLGFSRLVFHIAGLSLYLTLFFISIGVLTDRQCETAASLLPHEVTTLQELVRKGYLGKKLKIWITKISGIALFVLDCVSGGDV